MSFHLYSSPYPIIESDDSCSMFSASAVLKIALFPLSSADRYRSINFFSSNVRSSGAFPVINQNLMSDCFHLPFGRKNPISDADGENDNLTAAPDGFSEEDGVWGWPHEY